MTFNATMEMTGATAKLTLSGELDASTAPIFKEAVEKVLKDQVQRLVLVMQDLEYMASAGLRILIFAKQKMGANVDIYIVGAQELVMSTLEKTGFLHSVIVWDEYDADEIENLSNN
jgi:anti-anti-sigma factor